MDLHLLKNSKIKYITNGVTHLVLNEEWELIESKKDDISNYAKKTDVFYDGDIRNYVMTIIRMENGEIVAYHNEGKKVLGKYKNKNELLGDKKLYPVYKGTKQYIDFIFQQWEIEDLRDEIEHLKYKPNGVGYEIAKKDFENQVKKT